MRRHIACLLLIAGLAGTVFAGNDHLARFNEAKNLYDRGEFAQAITVYESLLAENQKNAALYYDLGNAYYRTQQMGRAILNYERALRLAPRDADVRHNIAFTRQIVKEPDRDFFSAVLNGLNGLASLNELTVLCVSVYLLFIAGMIVYLFRRSGALVIANAALLCALIAFSAWLGMKYDREVRTRNAIIIAGPAEVRNGPGSTESIGFTLPEGRKVILLGESGGWEAVGLETEGLKGWIEKRFVEAI